MQEARKQCWQPVVMHIAFYGQKAKISGIKIKINYFFAIIGKIII